MCAKFGWFGVGLACKEVSICVHLVQEGRDVGGLMVAQLIGGVVWVWFVRGQEVYSRVLVFVISSPFVFVV